MRRFLLAIALFCISACVVKSENLQYSADYHYGFIKITAGHADICLNINGDNLSATLNGHSIPWHGRVYSISDTLVASMAKIDGRCYETVVSESGWYSKPRVKQLENGTYNISDPTDYRTIYGRGQLDASDETMEAVTISADMLAMFYYFRNLNFAAMSPGEKVMIDITLPDGDTQQAVITYNGDADYNGSSVYDVTFEYSYHGEMSDYPVNCMVSKENRLPLIFSAELKIGHIELILTA